jgi:hypothetical protein
MLIQANQTYIPNIVFFLIIKIDFMCYRSYNKRFMLLLVATKMKRSCSAEC